MTEPVIETAGRASAIVSFPADSAEDVATKVGGWVLHEGCTLTVSFTQTSRELVTDADGVPGVVPEPEPAPET